MQRSLIRRLWYDEKFAQSAPSKSRTMVSAFPIVVLRKLHNKDDDYTA